MPVAKGRSGPGTAALAAAQSGTMREFERLTRERLGPLLGPKGLRRVDFSTAISTVVGGGLIVHAGIRHKKPMTVERVRKEAPAVGILANTIPLIDPVSRTALPAGVWVVRLRPLRGGAMAFDFHAGKEPAFGVRAEAIAARQSGDQAAITHFIDIELDFPSDATDRLLPPGEGYACVSFLVWKSCWFWSWPEIHWPDWF